MGRLFKHLTCEEIMVECEDGTKYPKRVFEVARSQRLHWINHHIKEKTPSNIDVFTVEERDTKKRKATFYVTNNEKMKGLDVTVRGYPGKYINFHNYGEGQHGAEDSKWITPLQEGARIRAISSDQKQNKAIGNK